MLPPLMPPHPTPPPRSTLQIPSLGLFLLLPTANPSPPLPAADSSHRGALIPPLPIAGPSITPPMPRLSPSKTPRLHNPHASRRRLSLTQRNSTNPASPTVPMGRFFTKCARGDIWVLAATSDAELLGLAEIISAASVM
ncbi:Os06g0629375 [Oryza sativa Japonica Group]|uniref:Os06g0629375 protein n=1 Tax=Oryza sativa subsp. japonica TaxID=39947 RepID=A0A0P0WZ37_ORYSJ|nr:Os06g0629375 [Oryza sativa Japonica Group]